LRGQRQAAREVGEVRIELAKLREGVSEYSDVESRIREARAKEEEGSKFRQKQPEQNAINVEERTYAELAKQLHVDQKLLREQLPEFAQRLTRSSSATSYERASAAYVTKDYSQAEQLALEAADVAQRTQPPRIAEAINALLLAGRSAQEQIQYSAALNHLRDAEKLTGRQRDPIEWANVQWAIAKVLDDAGKSAEAENLYRSAIAEYERLRGREDKETLSIRNDLGVALYDEDKFVEAEAEHRDVLKLREKILGPEHPDTLTSRDNMAMAEEDQGKYAEAEAEHRAALQIREKVLGPTRLDTLTSRDNLAAAIEDEGKYAEAAAEFRRIVKIKEQVFGPEDPETLGSRNYLGYTLNDLGEYSEAEVEFRAVLKI
jgi:tetratricopeptide (TPR) repeat protein